MAVTPAKFKTGDAVWLYRTGQQPRETVITDGYDQLEGFSSEGGAQEFSAWYYHTTAKEHVTDKVVGGCEDEFFARPGEAGELAAKMRQDAWFLDRWAKRIAEQHGVQVEA